MRSKKRFRAFVIILLIAAAAGIPYINSLSKPTLSSALTTNAIPYAIDEEIHFYQEGFILLGAQARFYTWDGMEAPPPLKQDDLASEGPSIHVTQQTSHYIVTDRKRIYDTSITPFNLIYENSEISIWDIKEYGDFLLLLIQNDTQELVPHLLVQNSDFLIPIEGLGSTRYISSASYKSSKDLSILTMGLDAPVPVSRVLHFTDRNQPFGVLTLEDTFIYNIYRLKSHIILIGNDMILCYNIEGEQKWQLEMNTSGPRYSLVSNASGALLYFPEKQRIGSHEGNALILNEQGDYSIHQFPKYLSHVQTYQKGYIGLEYKNTIVFMDKLGRVTSRQRVPEQVDWLGVSDFQRDLFFMRSTDQKLLLYGMNVRKDESE